MEIIVGKRGDSEVLKLKSCPKCKSGDIAIDRDHHGWYEYCIQCGYMSDLITMAESEPKQTCGGQKRAKRPDKGD
jgi:Zn ribbon nucleic-acid-binding protein